MTYSRSRLFTIFLSLGFAPVIGGAAPNAHPQSIEGAPTLEVAMAAPPGNVAIGYMNATWGLRLVQLARMNETVATPEGQINKDNAPQWQKLFAAREAIYRQAIAKRGVASFAGNYRLSSESPSCVRAGSSFAAMIANERFSGRRMTITQSGFELRLNWAHVELVGAREAWAVENSFAFNDPMNANYVHLGELHGDQLVIRPQADVLKSPPAFERAPTEEDIRSCAVILTREKP
jgi:hypothetical protein